MDYVKIILYIIRLNNVTNTIEVFERPCREANKTYILESGKRISKEEMERVTDHGTELIGERRVYTANAERVAECQQKLLVYYKVLWQQQLEQLQKKIALLQIG